jgi:hypothetical protein
MIFALEVVEKGSLTDVSGFGNLFHRNGRKTALGKELQSAPKEPKACFGGAPLASARGWGVSRTARCRAIGERKEGIAMTFTHVRLSDVCDHQSFIAPELLPVKRDHCCHKATSETASGQRSMEASDWCVGRASVSKGLAH